MFVILIDFSVFTIIFCFPSLKLCMASVMVLQLIVRNTTEQEKVIKTLIDAGIVEPLVAILGSLKKDVVLMNIEKILNVSYCLILYC